MRIRRCIPWWVMLAGVALPGLQGAQARDVLYGKARETIPVAFGSETLFRFPSEVKTITEASRFEIKPANAEEPDYSVLSVKPRFSEGAADVMFLLADGAQIRAQLVISTRASLKRDSVYDFKPREDLSDTNPNRKDRPDPMVISELDLMRAMIRGDQISGFSLENYSQPIAMGSEHLSAELKRVYRGHDMNGYIYLLHTDHKEKRYEINLDGMAIGQPNLAVLAQVDRNRLGGQTESERETTLRVVARPGASSHRIILPVSLQSEKERRQKEDK